MKCGEEGKYAVYFQRDDYTFEFAYLANQADIKPKGFAHTFMIHSRLKEQAGKFRGY